MVFHPMYESPALGLCWGKTGALHGMLMCILWYLYGISSYVMNHLLRACVGERHVLVDEVLSGQAEQRGREGYIT